jgi:Trk K+ transport system NAD-binding subunit
MFRTGRVAVRQPILVCGLGTLGWQVLEYLRAAGLPVVAVDNTCSPDDPRLGGARLVRGDYQRREVLVEAGVAHAGGVLILASEELVNISAALMVRHLNPDVRLVLRMFNESLLHRLGKAVHNIVAVSTSNFVAPILAVTALTGQALGTFRVEGVEATFEVAEVVVGPNSPWRGRPFAEAVGQLGLRALAHLPCEGAGRYLGEVDPEAVLESGDRVFVCGEPSRLAPLLEPAGRPQNDGVHWASWLRRYARMGLRALGEVDTAVKVCTPMLVAVLLASVVVFRLTTDADLPTALYRTVSLLATGDDKGLDAATPALKVFVSVLRLSGTALTAAFTAILTNYLLRARLRGALEIRRVPDRGHIVVCGLGRVGFRLVEQLIGYGERVVVLEEDRDNRFVATARRLGAAVLHGDARVPQVLRQVNAATARAVVAATSNDLINLEIALLVRDLNPTQRVVLRLFDPHLAQTLRAAAAIRLAFSVSRLAAPAFVAALFGDRVLGVFLVGDRMLAAADVLVQPQDAHLIGQRLRAVAADYRLLPLALLGADGAPGQHLTPRLEAGSRLVAVLALPDLERLLGRQPVPRDCAVEVTDFSLPARDWVALLLRTQRGLSAEAADEALRRLPVCLGADLTRGQAEDLLALLARERVTGRLRIGNGCPI